MVGVTAYGDVGTGGANLDWQVLGTIDYRTNSWLTLRAGYRARRLFGRDTFDHQALISAVWWRRWL